MLTDKKQNRNVGWGILLVLVLAEAGYHAVRWIRDRIRWVKWFNWQ